jgi:hypothetical protein
MHMASRRLSYTDAVSALGPGEPRRLERHAQLAVLLAQRHRAATQRDDRVTQARQRVVLLTDALAQLLELAALPTATEVGRPCPT